MTVATMIVKSLSDWAATYNRQPEALMLPRELFKELENDLKALEPILPKHPDDPPPSPSPGLVEIIVMGPLGRCRVTEGAS